MQILWRSLKGVWFISDHHFGHNNIIKLANRPFNSMGHMHAMMLAGWNSVVEPDDTVIYVGDFARDPRLVTEILPMLNGHKILVPGNHDKCESGTPRWMQHYLKAGFVSIHKQLEMEIAGQQVLISHYPYRNLSDPKQKHFNKRPIDQGRWLIHGHVHNRWQTNGRQINVSVEMWNYTPVSLAAITALVEEGPKPRLSQDSPSASF